MFKKIFLRTARPISMKLSRKPAWGMGIHTCSNEGACPFWGSIRGNIRKMLINLEKSPHEPPARMHRYLSWSILGARIFKFVQI